MVLASLCKVAYLLWDKHTLPHTSIEQPISDERSYAFSMIL
jgi:hypothetical protein